MLKRKVADSIYDDLKLPNYDRLMEMDNSMCESITALPRGSEQGDVLLACMSTHFTYYQVQAKFKDITGAQFSEERYTEARKKMKSISGGLELKKLQRQQVNYKKNAVEKAVDFIFSESNIQILSWGTKEIMIGNKQLSIPKLCRKKIPMNILRAYHEYVIDKDSIGDSSFLKLVSTLTFNDMRSATSVDYATGILL